MPHSQIIYLAYINTVRNRKNQTIKIQYRMIDRMTFNRKTLQMSDIGKEHTSKKKRKIKEK